MRSLVLLLGLALAVPAVAQTPAGTGAKQPGDDKQKLICRREVPVGSLIATRKTCMTKAQWDAQARDGNEEARRMVELNQGRPTGN